MTLDSDHFSSRKKCIRSAAGTERGSDFDVEHLGGVQCVKGELSPGELV